MKLKFTGKRYFLTDKYIRGRCYFNNVTELLWFLDNQWPYGWILIGPAECTALYTDWPITSRNLHRLQRNSRLLLSLNFQSNQKSQKSLRCLWDVSKIKGVKRRNLLVKWILLSFPQFLSVGVLILHEVQHKIFRKKYLFRAELNQKKIRQKKRFSSACKK